MNDSVMAVVAVLMALALFIPAALFASGKWRPSDDEEKPASQEVAKPDPPTYKVEQTWTQKVTNVALTWVQQSIRPTRDGDRQALGPGRPGSPGGSSDRARSTASDDAGSGDDPPLEWDVDVEVQRPRTDTDDAPPSSAASFSGIIRKALPWLPDRGKPLPQPSLRVTQEARPQAPGLPAPTDVLGDDEPRTSPRVQVERLPQPLQPDLEPPPLQAVQPIDGPHFKVDPIPVELEGVDMAQAPLVPSGGGSAARLPSVGQLRTALATGGFNRLMAWLRAFKKASNNTLAQANALHADALVIARRTRNAYMMAMQAFQAVQADKLDRQTIHRVWQMLERTQVEAAAAAQVTRWTAQLVVAAGGQQPAVAAAVATLQRNHGQIAAAIKASPVNPVENVQWYRQ